MLPEDGAAVAAQYVGGLVRAPGGWRKWGSPELAIRAREFLAASAHRGCVRATAEAIKAAASTSSTSRGASLAALWPAARYVRGELRDNISLADVLKATFPCGSVTGAPKIAAMRGIARLERSPRGAYTGSLLVATRGHLDSSVLIRTAEYGSGLVRWGTGCGITVDSDPEAERQESVLRAAPICGMLRPPAGRSSSSPFVGS